ncbi:bifunctional phosphoribosylaminoimidazolecarboxamide formyltransferase/IMP cyclohydrolase [Prochlorococcus marinus]|uniref:Bifunctional purine biosynthesis protein PurH n=1 Tax=Prochlorococcus marinus XMU1408 TaxID=2213228 RepID=A0A318R3F3_PROMR|nr:bifunctional phosphoribosylaminoimidazolecarboxamide formyltransferase/IMP cyclohydrolase [Prochlorococcus marinus]MBW3041324.1 bifunctional phosphoribosylaminoimidazolecarboxamide formyltransferase/inosine monophosphate cyclohydrolase [Prochlorococcus marinus str. XMU1408]PYE02498.1 bifunctional phosphoribosylaminoimidazolecarboxamide formyltransferase/inosine monophosphate cyclohydrolase [Prochlorococcus marinus XMU1408]
MSPIALLSVSDKTGLIPLAKALVNDFGFKIISSGGTAKLIESENLPVTRVADYTGFPEILEGRVKTLNPKIHGGILARRDKKSHLNDLNEQNINPIDLVVVNLYPFEQTISKKNVSWEEAIENIDIGGPAMIRAAAKNHQDVLVVTNPNQYPDLIDAYRLKTITNELRKIYSQKAFEHTAIYDLTISKWIANKIPSKKASWLQAVPLKQKLRYGENPHQKASWYGEPEKGWSGANQLQGKELSTNNLLDLEAALSTLREFGYENTTNIDSYQKAAVVIKHTNPCGVATGDTPYLAIKRALDGDRVSAFGGIIAINCTVDEAAAKELENIFIECIVAPCFDNQAQEILSKKKNLRLLELKAESIQKAAKKHIRSILGGLLIQDSDEPDVDKKEWKNVTNLIPNEIELNDLSFAWKIVKHIRSNAIAVASNGQSLGIGAGQMNRIGSAKLALEAAGIKSKGAVLASDGFFPFDDTVKMAADYGITSIIQPGGSIRDNDSISACNDLGIKMVFTGKRHFLH